MAGTCAAAVLTATVSNFRISLLEAGHLVQVFARQASSLMGCKHCHGLLALTHTTGRLNPRFPSERGGTSSSSLVGGVQHALKKRLKAWVAIRACCCGGGEVSKAARNQLGL